MADLTLHHQVQVPTTPDQQAHNLFWRVTFSRIARLIKEGTAPFVTRTLQLRSPALFSYG